MNEQMKKDYHEELVLMALSESEIALYRKEIIIATGMKRTTVYDTLQRLIEKEMVETIYQQREKKGRNRVYYQERRKKKC